MADGSGAPTLDDINETQLVAWAKEAFEKFPDDFNAATTALVNIVRNHPEVYDNVLWAICRYKVGQAAAHVRKNIWRESEPSGRSAGGYATGVKPVSLKSFSDLKDRAVSLSQGTLSMFPLPNTLKPLGQATKEEVEAAAQYYKVRADGASAKMRWLGLIAYRLQPGQRVAAVLGERALKELKTQAGDRDE